MSASLVGSEMCIRDRSTQAADALGRKRCKGLRRSPRNVALVMLHTPTPCLLYTSDAADDM
eukprot:12567110-Alexandrium_andersonii.AAC.1